MSYYNDFLKELKKRGLTIDDVTDKSSGSKSSGSSGKSSGGGSSVNIGNSSFANEFKTELKKRGLTLEDAMRVGEDDDTITPRTRVWDKFDDEEDEDDIAPVKESKLDFFQKGAFEDGYQFGDVTKAILGTAGDVGLGVLKGVGSLGEGIGDLITYGVAGVSDVTGNDRYADSVRKRASENLVEKMTKGADDYLDQYSVLGRTSGSITQGIGQVGGILLTGGLGAAAGLGAAGTTALTTGVMGLSGMGSGMGEAYQGGATDEEALVYGTISGAADALTELMFGGLGKAVKATGLSTGLSSADDMLAKKVSSLFTNHLAKNVTSFGIKAGAEGFEEVVAGTAQALGKKMTYMSEEELGEILEDENLLEQFVVGAVTSGIAQSGIVPGMSEGSLIEANKTGKDFITGFSQNEQAVIKKEVENRIAEQEKDGKKLTAKEKANIEAQVEKDMEKGYISTDTIEEVLGGETYKSYRDTIDSEDALQQEFDTLNKMKQGEMTGEQIDRRVELKDKLAEIKEKSQRNQLKSQLGEEVFNLVQGDRLAESYNERTRRTQAFQADLAKYDEKQQAVVKKAVESGILNNTNRTHEFVDMVAKISADTGVLFDFTNNAKLKESGYSLNGKIPNGYVTKDGIVVNVDSPKSRRFVVGHEITHVLEGTELYGELQKAVFDYAKTKGEYDSKMESVTELYKKYAPDADPMNELTSDLVGEYLFSDPDFINNLSTEHRNVFQKVYDEIKYLLKVATAGSKEARELEKVKRAFDKAYRESGTKNTAVSGVKYSISETTDGRIAAVVDNDILSNIDTSSWDKAKKAEAKKAAAEALKNFSNGIVVDGVTRKVNKQSRREYTRSNDTEKLYNRSPDVFADKMRAAEVADDIVVAATNWNRDGGLKHPRQDNFVDFDHGTTLIVSGNSKYIAEVVVGITDTGDAVFYDVVDMTPTSFDIKKVESSTTATTQDAIGDIQEDSTFDTKVAQYDKNVKSQFSLNDTTGRQLSNEQAEYFKDSKVRDESGNLKVMYHGTPNGDFTVFKDGTYFTESKEYADRYQNPGASSISTGKMVSNPKTFEVYLDIKKPFDLSDAEARRIYIEDYIKGGNAMGINPYLPDAEYAKIDTIDWTEGEDLRDFLTENGYDYDGLVLDEGADGGYGDAVNSRGKSYVVFSPEQVKNVDNAKPTGDPDIRFSLSEAVEETKELMAIHNLHTNEVLKQLEMGGMPYPSVAITNPAKIAHDDFGEISIVLHKDAIDPKKSKYNHIYSSDAYTPTFPHVSYEANQEVAERISNRIKDQFDKLPDYHQRSIRSLRDYTNLNDILNRWGGMQGLIDSFADDHGMKQVYLAEKGENVPMEIVRTETQLADHKKEQYQKVLDKIGTEELASLNDRGSYNTLGEARIAWTKEHLDTLKDIYAEDWASDGHLSKEEALEIANEEKLFFWYKEAVGALEYMQNGGITVVEKEDYDATNAKIDEKTKDGDYKQWLAELFDGIEGQSGIRNSKDTFMPSGKRRSFAQLHDPVTIDNVIKAMRKKEQTGQGAFGTGNFGGAAVQEYGSIAEAKRNSNMLGVIDETEYNAIKKSIDDRLFDITYRYANGKDIIDAKTTIVEAVAKYESKSGIANYLKQYDYVYKYTDDIAEDVIELRDYVRSLPRPYFEAKPRRAVGFDEVGVFVIPYDADIKLKQELLNRGYSIAEYDPKVDGDRQRVLNQFEELKFSLSDVGTPQRPVSDPLTDLRLETVSETESVAEDAPAAVSKMETTTEDLFPDDLAPAEQELEFLVAEREDIKGAMDAYAAVGDYTSAEQLMTEYEAVQARIEEIESDDAARFASIDETDAPPEIENNPELDSEPEDVADNVPLTKVLIADLAKQVKAQLGLGNNRTAEVRELIERYSNEEFPSKAHLYTEIQERFGKYTETEIDDDLKGIKSLLRTYGINVDESIKGEIADYAQLMRSNFGKVRFSKEGLPVDVAYKEFQEALPGYFPENIYVPADQLMRIIEVANMDTRTKTEYEIDWQTLEDATDTIMNGVAKFKQNRKEVLANRHGREAFDSLMESADRFAPPVPENIAPVRRTRPAIQNIQSDPDDIAPVFDTSSGQQSLMPEEEVPKKVTRKELHMNIMDNIKAEFGERGFDFDEVLKNAKDLSTFATVDNTPQRVLEKALGYKEGQTLSDLTVNQVAQNETEGIRWLNSFTDKKTGLLAKISNQYGIKPGSKASAAAQMYAEGFYVGENDAIIEYGDKELAADFPDTTVQENIKKLARDPRIRQIYDETLTAINASRTRNAYPEIPKLDNYFLHFRAMEDTFSRLGLPFNPNDIRAKDLPTDLNGVTADLKPGQPYFASAKHRTGKRTSFDLLGGLEKYLTSAKNQIYHIDDIQTLRALRNYVAETYGQATGLQDLDLLSDEEAEQRIEQVYNSHLSTLAKFLNEEANVLAGKTSLIDRGLEGVIGRRGITFLDTLNRQVGANMVGFNVSSSLTNFIAPVQAFAKSNKFDFVKAMAQTAANKLGSIVGKGDNFTEESPVMIRRKGAERFYRTPYEKVADKGYILMGVVDDLSTELIARTKYNEFTRKGMDAQQAHYETDKWVSRLMGDRSLGQQPQLYNSKMLGLFTKFQLEVRNQLDSQFYDTIQEAKASAEQIENGLLRNAKKAAKITSTFAQLAVMQHLFGKAFESVAGYNPAFDIIEALIKTMGWDDEEEDEDTVLDNIEEGFLSLLGDLPYTSTLTGGRIPIASALPVTELIKGEDQYGNEKSRWDTLGEAAPYYLLPGGYGQIKKTQAGLEVFSEEHPIAGSYTDSGNLRFPVEDTVGNRVQAGLFGQWASENARDYFNNERKPLKEKQIQELIEVDLPIREYWDYRDGLAEQEKLEDKIDYIAGLDLPISKKNILVNNVSDRKNPIDLTDYDEFATYEEFDFASKNPEKYDFLQENSISYSDYRSDEDTKEFYDGVYEWVNNYPDKVTVSKAVTDSVVQYRKYAKDLDAIRADKDSNGKTINGSAKAKKLDYISSLDIDEGAKYILFKNEYNADDTFNYEIIDYLNGRDDVSRDEMITILKELGFEVHSDGTVTW